MWRAVIIAVFLSGCAGRQYPSNVPPVAIAPALSPASVAEIRRGYAVAEACYSSSSLKSEQYLCLVREGRRMVPGSDFSAGFNYHQFVTDAGREQEERNAGNATTTAALRETIPRQLQLITELPPKHGIAVLCGATGTDCANAERFAKRWRDPRHAIADEEHQSRADPKAVQAYRDAAYAFAQQAVRENWKHRSELLRAGYQIKATSGSTIFLQKGASAYGCFPEGAPYCRPL